MVEEKVKIGIIAPIINNETLTFSGGAKHYLHMADGINQLGEYAALYVNGTDYHTTKLTDAAKTGKLWMDIKSPILPQYLVAFDKMDAWICADPRNTGTAFWQIKEGFKIWYSCNKEDEIPWGDRRSMLEIFNNSDAIIANSTFRQQDIMKYGFPCTVIENGVNFEKFYPDRTRTTKEFRVLVYGAFDLDRKGTRDVIKGLQILKNKYGEEIQVDVVYFGKLYQAQDIPFKHTFIDGTDTDTLRRTYSNADVFVSAELHAGWCNTAAEAAACKCNLVCTPAGTTEFAINNATALLIPPRCPEAIVHQVESLYLNAEFRNFLKENAYKCIQQFTWDRAMS